MSELTRESRATRTQLWLALAAVYLLWGSTYLAIRVAVETLPPLLMAGARFVTAGLLLMAWARWRGEPAPRREHWPAAIVSGALLMLCSNGLVCWAQTRVDSGMAALIVACVPLWMLIFDAARKGGVRPRAWTLVGVACGIGGVVLLVLPSLLGRASDAARPLDALGVLALIGATCSWSLGSIYSRTAHLPPTPLCSTALQMFCGGVLQLLGGSLIGEWSSVDPARITWASIASVVYLMIAGSLVGFTAYVWLLRHTTSAVATSYAFVNPLVALVLGAVFAGERIDGHMLAAAAAIVLGVVLVVVFRAPARVAPRERAAEA